MTGRSAPTPTGMIVGAAIVLVNALSKTVLEIM
jgi:hypothetical protein